MSKVKNNTVELQAILDTVNQLPTGDVGEYEVYDGSYTVTPLVTRQTLATNQKLMQADMVIEKIPYAEVSNNSGGITATIGNEV